MGNFREDFNRVNVRKKEIILFDLEGHRYIKYAEFMELFLEEKYLNIMSLVSEDINKIIIDSIAYIPVTDLVYIFQYSDDIKEKDNILSQIFRTCKAKPTAIESLETALKTLSHLENLCKSTHTQIHEYDYQQCDMLHDLENKEYTSSEIKDFAIDLKKLRETRRKSKNKYRIINYVQVALNKQNIKNNFYDDLYKNIKELKEEIFNNPIYNYRSKDKLEESITNLKNHFNN